MSRTTLLMTKVKIGPFHRLTLIFLQACAPVTWVPVEGRDNIPRSALVVGDDNGAHPVVVARAFIGHGLRTFYRLYFFHPLDTLSPYLDIGKASPKYEQGTAIGYAGKVIEVTRTHLHTIPVHELTSK